MIPKKMSIQTTIVRPFEGKNTPWRLRGLTFDYEQGWTLDKSLEFCKKNDIAVDIWVQNNLRNDSQGNWIHPTKCFVSILDRPEKVELKEDVKNHPGILAHYFLLQ